MENDSMTRLRELRISSQLLLTALFLVVGCHRRQNPVSTECDHWISDIPFTINTDTLSHDNRIYETQHFLTFSDGSSDDVKHQYSSMAEESFSELLQAFEITSGTELGITDRTSKITIYSDRYLNHTPMAFAYGFIIGALDSPVYQYWPDWQKERYRNIVKHETMHVLQFLMGLTYERLDLAERPDTWFTEGIAEYVSGGAAIPITDLDQVNEWLTYEDHINPISIHRWSDLPVPDARSGEYYPMFGLALAYLLDERGQGKTLPDVKRMYEELSRGGCFFTEAFEAHMGISVPYFETHFFQLITDYLGVIRLAHSSIQ